MLIADASIVDFIWILIAVLIGIVSFIKGLIERLAKARQNDAPPRPISETIREELRRVLGSDEKEPSTPPPPPLPQPGTHPGMGRVDATVGEPLVIPLARPRTPLTPTLLRGTSRPQRKRRLERLIGGDSNRDSLRRAIIGREILEPRFRRFNPLARRR